MHGSVVGKSQHSSRIFLHASFSRSYIFPFQRHTLCVSGTRCSSWTHLQSVKLLLATDPVLSYRDFQSCVGIVTVSHPSLFAWYRVSSLSFDQCVHRDGGFVLCLLESLTLFLPMTRSEAAKRILPFRGVTHSKSSNRAHFRDCSSRVHRCTSGYLLSWILFKPVASGVARSQATYGDVPTYGSWLGVQSLETMTECILIANGVFRSFRLLMVPISLFSWTVLLKRRYFYGSRWAPRGRRHHCATK